MTLQVSSSDDKEPHFLLIHLLSNPSSIQLITSCPPPPLPRFHISHLSHLSLPISVSRTHHASKSNLVCFHRNRYVPTRLNTTLPPANQHPHLNHHQQFEGSSVLARHIVIAKAVTAPPKILRQIIWFRSYDPLCHCEKLHVYSTQICKDRLCLHV